jgi:K+-transporting ATPase A subunit
MSASWLQFAVLIVLLLVAAPVLGRYIARVYGDGRAPGDRLFLPVERLIYRLCRASPSSEQRWTVYALSVIGFSLFSFCCCTGCSAPSSGFRSNPTDLPAVPDLTPNHERRGGRGFRGNWPGRRHTRRRHSTRCLGTRSPGTR